MKKAFWIGCLGIMLVVSACASNPEVKKAVVSPPVFEEEDIPPVRARGELLAIVLTEDMNFELNATTLKPELYPEIDRIASVLSQYPDTEIRIEGHTDNIGSDSANMEVSLRRANAVKNLFVEKGIEPSRIQVIAYGESHPIASNQTEEGRKRNRRVEIKVKSPD